MGGDVLHLIGLADDTAGIDEIRDAPRQAGVVVVGCPGRFVRGADDTIDVGQQRETEPLRVGERLVLRGGVERRAEYDGVCACEVSGPVTQGLSFDRSARR